MACFIGKNSITCYSGLPEDCVSKIKTKYDGQVYLSRYTEKLFKAMKSDAVVELYYRVPLDGYWRKKKFIKSAVEFVCGLDDSPDCSDVIAKATAISIEVD